MTALQKLFKHTFIYGIATVLPRILSFILTPFYVTQLESEADFGMYAIVMSYLILGNVVLSYGMETAFFRFINKSERKAEVQATALTSILITTVLFFAISFLAREHIARWLDLKEDYVVFAIAILSLDALAVIPFAWFRNREMPIKYSFIKILNVVINFGFNLFFFLALPELLKENSFFTDKINFIFISNLIASLITFILVLPLYFRIGFRFDLKLWQKMLRYAFPVLIAGIAFSINEAFDRILLKYLLSSEKAASAVGVYAACYKLGVFMTLFITAFKLGVEPFFFSHANNKNAKAVYADVTLYFTIFGAFIMLFVTVYTDILKHLLMPRAEYWEALWIVPFILLANLCLGIYHNLSVWYKITDKTIYGAYISVLGAILTLALNFLLIPIISYKGSAIATLVAYGSMMLLSFYYGQKNYKIPYDLKKIGLYLSVSIVFSLVAFYPLDRNLYIGTLFVVIFSLMIIRLERRELKRLFLKK